MKALRDVMELLEDGAILVNYPEYNDHQLIGSLDGVRECHLQGRFSDWLLMYQQQPDAIIYYRTGTHSELLE